MRIMIIGSKGSIGTYLVKYIEMTEHICLPYDIEDMNINEFEKTRTIIERDRPDVIINCAVIQAIDRCEVEPVLAYKTNGTSICNLVDICNDNNITFVYLSTHAVFDGKKEDEYTEYDEPNPVNTYGASKFLGEIFTSRAKKFYIIRLPTMYGNQESGFYGIVEKFVDWLITRDELCVADDKLDTFTYINDAIERIMNIILKRKTYGIYHVCNNDYCTFYEFAQELRELLGSHTKLYRAKDEDFQCKGEKFLNGSMVSMKMPPLRHWKKALKEFIDEKVICGHESY